MKLRLNLGMGGEFLLHEAGEAPPEKRRMLLNLADGRSISVNFWWFGSLHAVKEGEEHKPFDSLGTDALDNALDEEAFRKMYCTRKAAIKTLLMDQKLAAGVGNYYSHDIFFEARLHPLKRACDLTEEEYSRLYHTMRNTFIEASEMGGADYERDLYNRLGRWSCRLVAYRKGEKCPVCGAYMVQKKYRGRKYKTCSNKDCASHKQKRKSEADSPKGDSDSRPGGSKAASSKAGAVVKK